jgi:hypothetical protein
MKKPIGKIVTNDIAFINSEVAKNSFDDKLMKRIEKFVYGIRSFLGHEYTIKKIGSYAMEGVYTFDNIPTIDLLAVKYLNRDFYKRYDDELGGDNHFLDCLCCHHKKIIMQKLEELFSTKDHIDVVYKKKVYVIDNHRTLTYTDSVLVKISNDQGQELFSVSIRVGLCSKELPVIICDEKVYRRSYAIQAVDAYRSLNNLLNKKLKYLFLKMKLHYKNHWSAKDLMFAKLKIMAQLEGQLAYSEKTGEWLAKVYKVTLNNTPILKKILKNKKLHYTKHKFFERVHKMLSLREMKWIFNQTYQNLDEFLETYLTFAKENHSLETETNESGFLYFYYDNNVFIDGYGQASYTIKKNNRLFDYLGIKKITKSVYPSEKEIEGIVLFLQYFAMDLYFVNNKYAKYSDTTEHQD